MSKLKMPNFETEAEEAAWWFDNQDALAAEYAEEHAAELLGLVLDANDVRIAVEQASVQGVNPRDYVRRLVHNALDEQRAA